MNEVNRASLPRILLFVDVPNWAYDICAQSLVKRLNHKYEFDIVYLKDNPVLIPDNYDIFYIYFWGEQYYKQYNIPPEKIIKEVASHRWEVEEKYGKLGVQDFIDKYLSDCAIITTVSKRLYSKLSKYVDNVYYCPYGIELDLFKDKQQRKGQLRIGWVGNPNDASKGLFDILIPATRGKFLFKYTNGKIKQTQLVNFYNSIDVIAIASQAEGQPFPIMESMACGCFPVSTDVGILPELVNTKFNGLIIDRTVSEFTEAFHWCNENLQNIRRIGHYNSISCITRCSWDNKINNFENVFNLALYNKLPYQKDDKIEISQEVYTTQNINDITMVNGANYAKHFNLINPNNMQNETYIALVNYYDSELLPLIPPDTEIRIVDIGSGHGHLIRYLLERGYKHVGGIDKSKELLNLVKEYLGEGPEYLLNTDAQGFFPKFKDYFDIVILFDVIEHFPEKDLLFILQAIFQSLRGKGRVIIRTPNMANILGIYSRYIDLTHYLGFTEYSLSYLLNNAGFISVNVHIPPLYGTWKKKIGILASRKLHRFLFNIQDRTLPKCFDKNLIMWATKEISEAIISSEG